MTQTTPHPQTACCVQGLEAAYRSRVVLHDTDLTVPTGVVMGIVGPNGAGKSTLLKTMLGIHPARKGKVTFFDQPLTKVRLKVGYVPQSSTIDWDFPTTVHDTVMMGTYGSLNWLARPGKTQRTAAETALADVGITDLAHRSIGQLSGGQRQRVLLARALAQQADLYLMDEPFRGVDAKSQQAIVDVLHKLRTGGKTVLLVHHDLNTVHDYCDHVTLLNQYVIASGPTEKAFTKAHIRTAYDITGTDHPFLDSVQ